MPLRVPVSISLTTPSKVIPLSLYDSFPAPVADWERPRVIALKEACPRTTLMGRQFFAIGQVFRCGEELRQRRDRFTENRTHHVGTVPAV
jgi:hypothetical protein